MYCLRTQKQLALLLHFLPRIRLSLSLPPSLHLLFSRKLKNHSQQTVPMSSSHQKMITRRGRSVSIVCSLCLFCIVVVFMVSGHFCGQMSFLGLDWELQKTKVTPYDDQDPPLRSGGFSTGFSSNQSGHHMVALRFSLPLSLSLSP